MLATSTHINRSLFMILIAAAATIVAAAHLPALGAKALCFDDTEYVAENPLVQRPSWASASRFLTEVWHPSSVHGYYQPLTMMSLMVDYALGGRVEEPKVFHLTSLALHVANVALLAILLNLLFDQSLAAVVAALLFGLHPLTVEPVPWIAERKTLLGAFFAFICLIAYVRFAKTQTIRAYMVTTIALILALLSKPTATPLPLVMIILDWWPLRRFTERSIWLKLPWFAIAALSACVTFVSQTQTYDTLVPGGDYPLSRIPWLLGYNLSFYFHMIVWPVRLSPHYPFPVPLNLSNWTVVAHGLATLALAGGIVASLRWTRAIAAGALVFVVAISPALQVIGFSNVPASDKFTYWPAVGVLLTLTWALAHAFKRTPSKGRRLFLAGLLIVVAAVEFRATRRQLSHWEDSSKLFARMTELAPHAYLTWLGRGGAAIEEGKFEEAISHFGVALSLEPHAADAHARLGFAYMQIGDLSEATIHFKEALEINPKLAIAHNNLATCHQEAGQLDLALEQLREAVRLRPEYALARRNLAIVLRKLNRVPESLQAFRDGLALQPDETTLRYDYAVILSQTDPASAISEYETLLKYDPRHQKALNNLAVLLAQAGRQGDATAKLRELLSRYPNDVQALNNLGVTLQVQGQVDEARKHLEAAIQFKPDYVDARFNLGDALSALGERERAREQYEEILRIQPEHGRARERLAELQGTPPTSAPAP